MSSVKAKAGAPTKGGAKAAAPEVAGGNKKRRRRRVTTVVDSDYNYPVCSSCNSRLVSISDVDKLSTLSMGLVPCSGTLSCAACGSMLTPLKDLAR
ncbi:Zn-finger protein [Pseudocowpox virus]|uniref:Zn-finger protein n=1 Tax=Pseudocowpox virus TaxID=129726 RepID=D3IZB3_9POXV|nr:Zn-finger protein [Pseudocowpox virus]